MINIAFDTLSYEIRSMLMNEPLANLGETKSLVYVNQPYISLGIAGELRDQLDAYLSEGGCDDALSCNALGVEGVKNSLLTGGLPVSLDINKGIHKAQMDATIATMIVLLITMTILFRSPRLAFFTMVAVGVVVLWQPLLMNRGDVNVNVFTAMISTIVFGIGVSIISRITVVPKVTANERIIGVPQMIITLGFRCNAIIAKQTNARLIGNISSNARYIASDTS